YYPAYRLSHGKAPDCFPDPEGCPVPGFRRSRVGSEIAAGRRGASATPGRGYRLDRRQPYVELIAASQIFYIKLMMSYRSIFSLRLLLLMICMAIAALISIEPASAQQLPPRPLSVYVNPTQPLSFGAFYQGQLGGSVIVDPNRSRSLSGDVVGASLGYCCSPALFEGEGLHGTLVSILNGPDVQLPGSNGGTMTLRIGTAQPFS